nr:histidine kinase [uncultured Dyadobacter sp.]
MLKEVQVKLVLFLLIITVGSRPTSATCVNKTPKTLNKIMCVYGQPLYANDPAKIKSLLPSTPLANSPSTPMFSPGTSVWMYIPYSVLLADTSRRYLFTGYQDHIEVYRKDRERWIKTRSAGKYVNFSPSQEKERAYVKLFDAFPSDTTTAFLVVCRKHNNYCFSKLSADLKSKPELVIALSTLRASAEKYSNITLPFLGISLTTIVLLLMKYAMSRDPAYIFHASAHILFLCFFALLYYEYPINIDSGPIHNPLIPIYLDKFFLFLSMSCLLFSVRFFYRSGRWERLNYIFIGRLAAISGFIGILTLFATQITDRYYLINDTCIIFACLIISFLVAHLVRIRTEITGAFRIIALGLVCLIIFVFAGFGLTLASYGRQINGYEFYQAFPMLLGVGVSNLFIIAAFTKREYQILQESSDLKTKAHEAEMSVFQKGLNPHFIFNCLNLIDSFLYTNDCSSARKVLFDFSDLLRLVIEKSPERLIPVMDEMRIVELYVALERSRTDHHFVFDVIIPEDFDTLKVHVPPLLIQPIVENSIKHGALNMISGGGRICVMLSTSSDNLLKIRVEDNGIGFLATQGPNRTTYRRGGHFGIALTKKRLDIMSEVYDVDARIDITELTEHSGTSVNLTLPLLKF